MIAGSVFEEAEAGRSFEGALRFAPVRSKRFGIAEARAALCEASASRLERVAHMLKGSCANFGATSMQDACARLEGLCREGSLEGADEILAEVEKEFHYVQLALERERPSV